MKSVETSCRINAPPDRIWAIMTDANLLQSADTGISKIVGDIGPNQRFKLWAEIAPKRAFALKVTQFKLNELMEWTGGMPFGLFTGRREFALTPEQSSTHLKIREEFTGPLSGIIWSSMPDLEPSFTKLVKAIQHQAEIDAT